MDNVSSVSKRKDVLGSCGRINFWGVCITLQFLHVDRRCDPLDRCLQEAAGALKTNPEELTTRIALVQDLKDKLKTAAMCWPVFVMARSA